MLVNKIYIEIHLISVGANLKCIQIMQIICMQFLHRAQKSPTMLQYKMRELEQVVDLSMWIDFFLDFGFWIISKTIIFYDLVTSKMKSVVQGDTVLVDIPSVVRFSTVQGQFSDAEDDEHPQNQQDKSSQ